MVKSVAEAQQLAGNSIIARENNRAFNIRSFLFLSKWSDLFTFLSYLFLFDREKISV
jgi:hypothetical protein